MTVGGNATGFDATRRRGGGRFVAAREGDHSKAAKTFQVFGNSTRIASAAMASAGTFVSAAGQRSTAHIFARRTTSVATFALALMSFAVLHPLTFVLTMEFRLVGALKLLPMASTSAFPL